MDKGKNFFNLGKGLSLHFCGKSLLPRLKKFLILKKDFSFTFVGKVLLPRLKKF